MRNGLAFNPAYAGSSDAFAASIVYRQQWTGFDGAPKTEVLSAHAPLKNDRVALGLLVYNDAYGVTNNTGLFLNYAFRIHLKKGILSLGLKAGGYMQSENLNSVITDQANDPVFADGSKKVTVPNCGAGIFYYGERFYTGFSIPGFLSSRAGKIYHDFANYNFMLTSGVLFSLSQHVKFSPSFLLNYSLPTNIQLDLTGNMMFWNFVWIGGSWRMQDNSGVAMIQFQISPQIGIGYSFDYSFGDLNKFNNGSHEVMLVWELRYKVKASNPRYF
jgi:type IX secretion system PorP/SprF family membrane protein